MTEPGDDNIESYSEEFQAEDTVSTGLDHLRTLVNQLASSEKTNHLAAWSAIQRPDALSAIADAWVKDEAQVSALLATAETMPGQVVRTRALRSALKRLVAERRRAALDRVIGVAQDPSLPSLGLCLGVGAPPAELIEPSLLDQLRVPRGYAIDPTGVFKLSVSQDGTASSTRIATSPIFIVGRTHDVLTGSAKRQVMWRTPAGWTVRAIDRGVVMNSQKLIGLSDLEVPVNSNSASTLVEWFSEFEAENMHRFRASQAASRMGWIKQGAVKGFLLPDGFYTLSQEMSEESSVELVPPSGMENLLDGWRPAGEWEEWLRAMEIMKPFTPMWIALYASAAAPLLEILGTPSFIVDFNGETSSGKTTALRAGASIWGRPGDNHPTAMYSWDTTKVYVERICGFLCNLPVILDETKRAKDQKTVRDVIYDFANGQGKGRGSPDGTRITASWRSVMLTSGEAAATSFSQDGGTRARVLSITGKPMGNDPKAGGPTAEELIGLLTANYGHLGRKIIHYLASVAEQHDQLREIWKQTREHYALVARTPVTRRHAANLAAMHIAASIIHDLGVPLPDEDPMGYCIEAIGRLEEEHDRPLAALIETVSWCSANQNRFWGRHETRTDMGTVRPVIPGKGWAGAWDQVEDWKYLAILPNVLREVLEPQGFHAEEVIDRWVERGWIIVSERRAHNKTVKSKTASARIYGAPMRVYLIARSAVDINVEEDDLEEGIG